MKLSRAQLEKLQKALNDNRSWSPVPPEPNWDEVREKMLERMNPKPKLPKRPPPFDEPGVVLNEPLTGVGLGFAGLRPVFIVRDGEFIDIREIQDQIVLNPTEAKYKVVTDCGEVHNFAIRPYVDIGKRIN